MSSIALGQFLLDGPLVVGLRFDHADARLGARLRQCGIDVRLYNGKREGRVIDLARQLARQRADAYVLAVAPASLALARQVVRQLRSLLPVVPVMFRGEAAAVLDAAHPEPSLGITWLPAGLDAAAAALLEGLGHATSPGPSDYDDPDPSPYISGLLTDDELPRVGLDADAGGSLFGRELLWLTGRPASDQPVVVQAFGHDVPRLVLLAARLRAALATQAFTLHVDAQRVDDAAARALAADPLLSVRRLGADAAAMSAHAPAAHGVNGLIACYTGIYPDPTHSAGLHHLVIDSSLPASERQAAYGWAAADLACRSTVVLHGNDVPAVDRLAPWPAETTACGGWPTHVHAVEPIGADAWRASFDGDETRPWQFRRLPLHRLDDDAADDDRPLLLTLDESRDVDALAARLSAFGSRGELVLPRPRLPKYLADSCRWTRRGTCQLTALKRVLVHRGGQLRGCGGAAAIGSTADRFDDLVLRLKRGQQVIAIQRECSVCPVRDDCSQCSQLPAAWAGRYCELRQAHPATALFVELFSMGPGLAALFDADGSAQLVLRASGSGLPNQLFDGQPGSPRASAAAGHRPLILSAGSRHIAWWRGTRRLVRLSPPLALMAEAWWSAGNEADIVRELCRRFSVSDEVASGSLRSGVDKLRTEGVIHA